jgi:arylsulfatase A-like enzyme
MGNSCRMIPDFFLLAACLRSDPIVCIMERPACQLNAHPLYSGLASLQPSLGTLPRRAFSLGLATALVVLAAASPLSAQRTGRSGSTPVASPTMATEIRDQFFSNRRPKLLVVLSVDQLRSDYLTRFTDQFALTGGLRRLLTSGAYMADAHYSHIPTSTGPGHSVVLSGARLAETGIVGNDWVTSTGKRQYCVEDEDFAPVGIPAGVRRGGGASPLMMRAETLGDVLHGAHPGQARTVAIAIKDRAAILLGGRRPDVCTWFDENSGRWISSTYYGTTLPLFVQKANQERLSDRWLQQSWDLLLSRDAYHRSHAEYVPGINDGDGLGTTFPLRLSNDGLPSRQYYKRLGLTPFGNEMVFELARAAVIDLELGRHNRTDLLALNFSSVDYAGHSYGPNSPHLQDMVLRLDQQLGQFLTFLDSRISPDDVVVVLTADHGVSPLPEWYGEVTGQDTRRLPFRTISDAAAQAIQPMVDEAVAKLRAAGTEPTTSSASALIAGWNSTFLTLHGPRVAELGLDPTRLRRVIAERLRSLDLIEFTATREDILSGMLASSPYASSILNGFHRERSGDVLVIPRPFVQITNFPRGTNHITPYKYDTHVPILMMGKSIRAGWSYQRADVRDITPTLAAMLGVTPPAQATGRVLHEILE